MTKWIPELHITGSLWGESVHQWHPLTVGQQCGEVYAYHDVIMNIAIEIMLSPFKLLAISSALPVDAVPSIPQWDISSGLCKLLWFD